MAQGIIPSLASIPRDHSLNGVVHQVQYGSSGMMKMAGAEVMPAYPYFTQEEIAAAYLVGCGTGNAAQRGVAADRVSPCQTRRYEDSGRRSDPQIRPCELASRKRGTKQLTTRLAPGICHRQRATAKPTLFVVNTRESSIVAHWAKEDR